MVAGLLESAPFIPQCSSMGFMAEVPVYSFSMPTHYQGSPEEVRALNTFIKLMRASGSLLARTSRPLTADGLTAGQFGVLETLLHLGHSTNASWRASICKAVGISP